MKKFKGDVPADAILFILGLLSVFCLLGLFAVGGLVCMVVCIIIWALFVIEIIDFFKTWR